MKTQVLFFLVFDYTINITNDNACVSPSPCALLIYNQTILEPAALGGVGRSKRVVGEGYAKSSLWLTGLGGTGVNARNAALPAKSKIATKGHKIC